MEQKTLEQMLARKMTVREMAKACRVHPSKIRYWTKIYGLLLPDRRKTSIIHTVDRSTLIDALDASHSISDVLSCFGIRNIGGNYKTLKRRMTAEGLLDRYIALVASGAHAGKVKSGKGREVTLESVLKKDSMFSRSRLKLRLIREKILPNICAKCGLPAAWQDERLVLVLDHINGDGQDNRLENLRLLCPNCHSQTPTFAGRNNKNKRNLPPDTVSTRVAQLAVRRILTAEGVGANPTPSVATKECPRCHVCFISKSQKQKYCTAQCAHEDTRKVIRPSVEELRALIWAMPTSKVSKQFGVSDKAVEKWCKQMGVEKPPRGYWAKQAPKAQPPQADDLRKMVRQLRWHDLCAHYRVDSDLLHQWCEDFGITQPSLAYWRRKGEKRKANGSMLWWGRKAPETP